MKTIPLFRVVNLPEMETVALEVLRSGRIANGDYVPRFEVGFGQIIGQSNIVSTVDMTSAMFLALHLAGANVGDEVLTTSFACLSTNSAIAQCGALPVWVDIKPNSIEIDVEDVIRKFTTKTKALILYHVAGYPGPAKELAALCQERGVALIEDCDNALYASRDGALVGSHGDFAVYSFYPTRQINTTEGGVLVCRSQDVAARARKLRRFGIDPATFRTANGEINPFSDIQEIGWSFTMNNLCAALGCAQLPTVAKRMIKTRENVAKLINKISGLMGIQILSAPPKSKPAYWVLLLLVNNRDKVLNDLRQQGVMASCIHQRNDVYTGFRVVAPCFLPNTKHIQDHLLAIPCGWWLSDEDLRIIATALQKATNTPLLS